MSESRCAFFEIPKIGFDLILGPAELRPHFAAPKPTLTVCGWVMAVQYQNKTWNKKLNNESS